MELNPLKGQLSECEDEVEEELRSPTSNVEALSNPLITSYSDKLDAKGLTVLKGFTEHSTNLKKRILKLLEETARG